MMILKFLIFFIFLVQSLFAEIVVVVNTNSTLNTLSAKDVKDIFLGKKKRFANGEKISLADHKTDSEVFTPFYIVATGKTPSQLNRYRVKRIFTGTLKPPIKLSSAREIISFLVNNDNAISYLNEKDMSLGLKVVYTLQPKK